MVPSITIISIMRSRAACASGGLRLTLSRSVSKLLTFLTSYYLKEAWDYMKKACYTSAYCDRGDSFIKCYFYFIGNVPKFIANTFDVRNSVFFGSEHLFKCFSPIFLSIPLTIPLLMFNLLGLFACLEKKIGDFVLI